MQLNRQERQDLAQFFDRRFPDGGERLNLARRAGLPCDDADNGGVLPWDDLVELAAARGDLARLAKVARAAAPDDANLRSLAELMAPRRDPLVWLALPAAGLAAMAALLLAAFLLWPDAEQGLAPPDLVSVAGGSAYASVAPTAATLPSGPSASGDVPVGAAAVEARPAPEASTAASTAARSAARASQRAALAGAASPASASVGGGGNCTAAQGQLIGWWYAGSRSPVTVGTTYTLPTHANVRADYPDEHNHFNARAALRCTLFPGDRIQVTHAARQVPGNAYWVPLYGGDLLAAQP